jgi:glutathione S-transferase
MTSPYIIYGYDNSCYTQKVRQAFSYLALPHAFCYKSITVRQSVEEGAGYTKVPVVRTPQGGWLTDSTQIITTVHAQQPSANILPKAPTLALLAHIIDDWLDEWVIRPAVFWRANVAKDQQYVAEIIARNLMGLSATQLLIDEQHEKMLKVADRLKGFLHASGARYQAGLADEADILDLMTRSFDLLARLFIKQPCILGALPTLPDFALYGLLKGHFLLDPTPKDLLAQKWPALLDFVKRLEAHPALSPARQEADMADENITISAPLRGLLRYIAEDFHGFLAANQQALDEGASSACWEGRQQPASVQAQADLAMRRADWARLARADQAQAEELLAPLGILQVLDSKAF